MSSSRKRRRPRNALDLSPFLWTGLGWGLLSTALGGVWGGLLWLLCALDLLALTRAIQSTMRWMSESENPERRAALAVQTMLWAGAKMLCLGGLGLGVWFGIQKAAPGVALFMGLGTLVMAPLLGAAFWSRKVLQSR